MEIQERIEEKIKALKQFFYKINYKDSMSDFLRGFKDKEIQIIYRSIKSDYKAKRKLTHQQRKEIKKQIIKNQLTYQNIWKILINEKNKVKTYGDFN